MKKILIIEDAPTMVKALEKILVGAGYQTVVAMDAIQATMFAMREKPDLIILDIMMPAGGGISVARKLNLSVLTSSIPIIVFTGASLDKVKEQMTNLRIKHFIEKPNIDFLIKCVNDILKET
ncbi:response regulator [Elusimicrobiota bacterium]